MAMDEMEMMMKRREHMHLAIAHLEAITEYFYGEDDVERWSREVHEPIEDFIRWLKEECPGVA